MMKLFNLPPEKKEKFSKWRLVISCVLIAALLVSTSIGLGFSKFNVLSRPLNSGSFVTYGLQAKGFENAASGNKMVVYEKAVDEDTVMSVLDGNIKITIPKTARGTNVEKADYFVLVYPGSAPSYAVDYSSTFAGNTYYQYKYYDNFAVYGFSYSNNTGRLLGAITDSTNSMSIEFKVGKDFVPISVNSGYIYNEGNGVIKYENIYRFSGRLATFDIRYRKDSWAEYADTEWYNTSDTSFTISTGAELAGLAAIVNGTADGIAQDSFAGKNITLGDDISLYTDEDRLDGNGKEKRPWVPIGSYEAPFSGNFDGNGYTISGLNIPEYIAQSEDKDSTSGLFGMIKGEGASANITDVTLEDVNLSAHLGVYAQADSGQSMGALAGYCDNCNISDVHVNQLTVNRDAKYIGGIIGRGVQIGSISDCSVENAVFDLEDCNNIGGIVGIHYGNDADVNISNCYVSADFRNVYASAGGIVGFGNGGAVGLENSYFIGSFNPSESDAYSGGILGIGFSGVDNDYLINNCYADCNADLIGHGYFGYQAYTGEKSIDYCIANHGNSLIVANSSWSKDGSSFTWESYATDAGYDGYTGTVNASSDCSFSSGMSYAAFLSALGSTPSIYWDIDTDDDGDGTATADPAQIVKENDHTVTLTATPDAGFEFDKWEIEGDYKESETADLTSATLTITPQSDITAKATFKQAQTYTITLNNNNPEGGTVTADKTTVTPGETVTVAISANAGYYHSSICNGTYVEESWVVDPDDPEATSVFTFIPTSDIVWDVDFNTL